MSRSIESSFRDPSGFLFERDGLLYRQVNRSYQANYDHLMNSGLYDELVQAGLLLPHTEVDAESPAPALRYKIIQPEFVRFISYPYEWCFLQFQHAALATLEIQKRALRHDMSLKDSSAYNIQFHKGKPVLIDTLSFERYREGAPWVAYRQFCQHFLAPLALISKRDVRLNQLLRAYIDGLPLDLASRLLGFRTRLDFALLSHIHLHARSCVYFADKKLDGRMGRMKISRFAFHALIDSLERAVRKLKWKVPSTEWGNYYQDTNYSREAFDQKKAIVAAYLDRIQPRTVWDLGANNGLFSRLASDRGVFTVSFDVDPLAVEDNYRQSVKNKERDILPLIMDLTNPSPAIGWDNRERMALAERGPADAVIALALIHHLAISNNVPLPRLAEFFARLCRSLVIEFVPKSDSQVGRLLVVREDIFGEYDQEHFEQAFARHFQIIDVTPVKDTTRTLYYMAR